MQYTYDYTFILWATTNAPDASNQMPQMTAGLICQNALGGGPGGQASRWQKHNLAGLAGKEGGKES